MLATQPHAQLTEELIVARRKPPDKLFFLVFSTVLLVLCCVYLPALFCVVPGFIFAMKVSFPQLNYGCAIGNKVIIVS